MSLQDIRLSTRITIGALFLVAAGAVGVMVHENNRLREAYLHERGDHLAETLHTASARLNQAVETLRQDLLFLSSRPPISGILRASGNNGHDAQFDTSLQLWEARLRNAFAAFSEAHPAYYRIHYIGVANGGREIVRVDQRDGKVRITPPDGLRAMAGQDYFQAALALRAGQVGLSDFHLDGEWSDRGGAPVPTLHASTPVFAPDGTLFGVLAIHMHIGGLLEDIQANPPPGVLSYIAGSDGQYLLHPEPQRAFGPALGTVPNIIADFPVLATMFDPQTSPHLPLQTAAPDGHGYLTAERLHFDPDAPTRFLLLSYHLPEGTVASQTTFIPAQHVFRGLAMVLLLGGLILLALRRMFAPLDQIAAVADKISAGERDVRMPATRGGEIRSLANALDTMLGRLSRREQEVLQLNAELEHRVEQRTREISIANEQLLEEMQRREAIQLETLALLRRNQILMATSMEGIHIMDADGNIIDANNAFCRMLGYSQAEVLDLNVADWNVQWTPDELRDRFRAMVGNSGMFETVHRRKDGSLIRVEISAVGEDIDGRPHIFAVSRDITQRKRTEDVLRRYKMVIDTTVDGFWTVDMQGNLLEANAAYAEMSGYTIDELTGMRISQLEAKESAEDTRAHIAKILEQGHDRFETRHRRKDGTVYDVEVSTSFAPDQQVLFAFCRDISERKQTERSLAEAKQAAEQGNRAKSLFLANMSHEIRTPLNGIIGLARLLEDASLVRRERNYVAKIQSSAQLLLRILNDVLDFSRIEAGAVQLEQAPFSLHEVINDIAVLVTPPRGKDIEVLFEIAADVPTALVGDALHLQQILLNLAGNAVKFTDAGEVAVSVCKMADDGQRVTLAFAVRDTGIGIAPEQQQHLFKAFTQAENTISRQYGGSGLGLAICARLAALMDGTITFSSQPGHGSEFHLTVTLERAPAATVPALALERLTGLRVLIVDDNAATRQVLQRTCESFRWHATVVASAQEALDYLRRADDEVQELDVLLLDQQMPDSDGLAMLSQAVADPDIALPLVVLMASTGEMTQLATAGDHHPLDGTLAKPFTPATLFETILRVNEGEPVHTAAASPWGRQLPNLHALVVEDNEVNQMVMQSILTRAGIRVEVAADGVEAVDILRNHGDAFDVVLMDIRMPRMDGYTATQIIREELGLTTLPIIAVTANALPADREHARRAGMNGHLAKPVDAEELLDTLAAYLPRAIARPAFLAPQPAPAPEPLPGVDLDKGLANLGGNRAKLIELLGRVIDEHGGDILKARQLLADGDGATAANLMHTLRGAAGYLGANELWRLATAAEEAIQRGDEATVAALAEDFAAAFKLIANSIGRPAGSPTAGK